MATLKTLTPVLIVDEVEPCVEFWTSRVGFEQTNQVPGEDGRLVFAILQKDGIELMYQTKASVAADSPDQKGDLTGHSTALFFTVPSMADLDALETALKGAPVVKERHQTFYGSTEFYVREPGGNVVGFAAF
jgi:uncharacterized glyoxalase superfamily protein PhnB